MTFSLNVERSNLQLQVQTSINSQIPPTFGYESVALPTKSQHHNDHSDTDATSSECKNESNSDEKNKIFDRNSENTKQ